MHSRGSQFLKLWLPVSLSERIHFTPPKTRQRIKNMIHFLLGENIRTRNSKRAFVASAQHFQSLEHLSQYLEYLQLFLNFLFIISFLGYYKTYL